MLAPFNLRRRAAGGAAIVLARAAAVAVTQAGFVAPRQQGVEGDERMRAGPLRADTLPATSHRA
jgi:hypothetical protein